MKHMEDSRTENTYLIMNKHINGYGRLFGGVLMQWIDEMAGIVAYRHAGTIVTTACVDNLNFKAGAYLGDTVVLIGKLTYVGRKSRVARSSEAQCTPKGKTHRRLLIDRYFEQLHKIISSDRKGEASYGKKIGIISDTHGLLRPEILEILKTCDCILHAGDVTRPELLDELRCLASIYVVRGNNDGEWAAGIAKTLRFRIEGVEFFMTHNKKDVAWELGSTQVVIFGHTHSYFEKTIDGRLWLNPGSCGRSRFGQDISMAVMTVENGTYHVDKIVFADK